MKKSSKLAGMLGAMLVVFSSVSAMESVKPNGCEGPVLCPITPLEGRGDCCHRWHVDIGLLYQQPTFADMVAGSTYVPVFNVETSGSNFADQTITKLNQCLDYSIGLTASLGHVMKHDNWYLGARFDWISASTASTYDTVNQPTVFIAANENFRPWILNGSGMDAATEAFSKVVYAGKIDIYMLDIILSRGSYMSKCYSYEPLIGVKGLWYYPNQTATYYSSSHLASGNAASWNEKQRNWGVGPMFGFNAEYYLVKEIAIFSDSDIALLYGETHKTETSALTGVAGSLVTTPRFVTDKDFVDCAMLVPMRTIIGLKFSRYCLEDTHHIALKIGYDLRYVLSAPEDSARITMSGLYTDLVWHF